ncbi:GntR family transcriptional regulator [Nonomuraea sp. MG754425]|nr:GntR family transcriptional regulator [Nonomuraea sp. MG754425]
MLDRDSPIPIYIQVAEMIQELIITGQLQIGEAVPSEAALAAKFGIAVTTARNVASELRRRGLVHTLHGEGTFVGPVGAAKTKATKASYVVISDEIADLIRSGELRPNRSIPSEKALMRKYGVSRATARKAVSRLREQRWVFTVPYRGTYVANPSERPE